MRGTRAAWLCSIQYAGLPGGAARRKQATSVFLRTSSAPSGLNCLVLLVSPSTPSSPISLQGGAPGRRQESPGTTGVSQLSRRRLRTPRTRGWWGSGSDGINWEDISHPPEFSRYFFEVVLLLFLFCVCILSRFYLESMGKISCDGLHLPLKC